MTIKKAILYFILACAFLILSQAVLIFISVKTMDYNAYRPFEQIRPNASFHVLFAGDSTVVGIGAATPQESTAGWFSKEFPNASIHNISRNGWKIDDLIKALEKDTALYDVIVLQIGANDIIRLTPMPSIAKGVRTLLTLAKQKSPRTIILHSGKVGTAPMFIWPLSWIFTERSYQTRHIYQQAALELGADYVDLIGMNVDQLYLRNQKDYYAPDHLHLSSQGYRIWYNAIRSFLHEVPSG